MVSDDRYQEFFDLLMQLKRTRILPVIECDELTPVETRVVLMVSRAQKHMEEVRPNVLSQLSKMTPSALSQIIRSLCKKDIVERKHRSEDYRAVYITLTPKGEELAKTIEEAHLANVKDLVEFLGEDDLNELIRILKKVDEHSARLAAEGKGHRVLNIPELDVIGEDVNA